jgi:hypothetical protein
VAMVSEEMSGHAVTLSAPSWRQESSTCSNGSQVSTDYVTIT